MNQISRISTEGLAFSDGQLIVLGKEVLVDADGKASVVSVAAKALDPKMGVVYLHLDGLGDVYGVRIQYDGNEPPENWWERETPTEVLNG